MPAYSFPRHAWLDVAAPAVPAAATAWSAALLAPLYDLPAAWASPLAAVGVLLAGWLVMRAVPNEAEQFPLRVFHAPEGYEAEASNTDLLLDRPLDERLDDLAELLLDDPLPAPAPGSRVVQLFPDRPMPSPSELRQRIDRHLGMERGLHRPEPADASDSLRQALDELRESLARR